MSSLGTVIFSDIEIIEQRGQIPDRISGISQDSRLIRPGWAFVARAGMKKRGLDFVGDAITNGAVLVITDGDLPSDVEIPIIKVADIRSVLSLLSHRVFGFPSEKLVVIGVTGTKGKSSSVILLKHILNATGIKTGLIGTILYDTGARILTAPNTTPDIDHLCGLFADMLNDGCTAVVMEVSSHALELGRVEGVRFSVGAFSNLTREHLDFHSTMEAYFLAKKKLFDGLLPGGIAVANADSSYGERIVRECRAGEIITFGRNNSSARLRYEPIRQDIYGSSLKFHWENGEFEVETQLVGDFQGENIALAVAVALGLGIRPETIAAGIKSCRSVPGRMEAVNLGQPFGVYADYAHAPDALQKVLETARKFCSGRLFVVFGCGGDRDRGKRPIMGRIATELSDRVIITSDNSRSEKPDDIIKMILSGIAPGTGAKVTAEPNRRKAIFYALGLMKENDVLLICGKGHENYQEIDGIRHDFDDRLVAAEALKELGWDFTFK